MSNQSPKILWPIDYSSMTSITHRWHRLLIDVIDYSSMIHRLVIDYYTAHERHFSCFLVPFFSFVILLSVLDAFFLVSEDPEDPALREKGNELLHQPQIGGRNFRICSLKMALKALYKDSKYPSHGVIAEFAKLNNLDGATVKVRMVQQQTAKRYWRTFWTLISMYHLSWKE